MTEQVTITLPADVLQRAQMWAQRTGRPVPDILAETIELSFRPLGTLAHDERPLSTWSDEEVLRAVDATLAPAEDAKLSELLGRQQAGLLAHPDRAELSGLMQRYQDGLLRKADALVEAVRRGLRPAPRP